jgi:hypothetical protein
MSRPHEDRERHTLVDHRGGGPPIVFPIGTWCAIETAHVAADRSDAAIAAYETLIAEARSGAVRAAETAILRSDTHRRVIALVALAGHDAFRRLQSAWDDHKRVQDHRDKDEARTLALYRVAANAGDLHVDSASDDCYALERVDRGATRIALPPFSAAFGFTGVTIFATDDERASVLLYRFAHAADFTAFRKSFQAREMLGSADGVPDALVRVVAASDVQ